MVARNIQQQAVRYCGGFCRKMLGSDPVTISRITHLIEITRRHWVACLALRSFSVHLLILTLEKIFRGAFRRAHVCKSTQNRCYRNVSISRNWLSPSFSFIWPIFIMVALFTMYRSSRISIERLLKLPSLFPIANFRLETVSIIRALIVLNCTAFHSWPYLPSFQHLAILIRIYT